jgi:hypothetical protein
MSLKLLNVFDRLNSYICSVTQGQRRRIAMMKTFQVNVNGDVQSVKDIKKIGVRIQPIFQNRR